MPRVLLCVFVVAVARCMAAAHYKNGEKVRGYVTRMRGENVNSFPLHPLTQITVYVNKVGPYFNPQETYHYYSLPVCRPDRVGTLNGHTVHLFTRLLSLRGRVGCVSAVPLRSTMPASRWGRSWLETGRPSPTTA